MYNSSFQTKHYPCDYPFDTLVDIFDIYMGPEMHEALEIYGTKMHGLLWEYPYGLVKDYNLYPLKNIDTLNELFFNNENMDPVKLEKDGSKYNIINGRHRIVLSILYGYTHVPAIII